MLSKLLNSIVLLSKNALYMSDGGLCLFLRDGGVYILDLITSRSLKNHFKICYDGNAYSIFYRED